MSVEVKMEAEDKEQEWWCSVKREPALGPLQTPDASWPRAGTTAAMCTVKQELSEEGTTSECSENKIEESMLIADLHCHSVKLETDPGCVKEELETEEEEEWCGVSREAERAGLYAGHAVKRELLVGPELLQAPHITPPGSSDSPPRRTASQAVAGEGTRCSESRGEQFALRSCSVPLERMCIDKHPYTRKEELHEQSALMELSVKGVFPNKVALPQHKRARTADEPHECPVCSKLFRRHYDLKIHCQNHKKDNAYACDICKKQFSKSSSLMKHKRVHTGEKPYACDICNKRFTYQCNLSPHKRIHTGQKPYACAVCNKEFTQSSNLIRHERIHVKEKSYVCDICNKQFNGSQNLIIHLRIHTGDKPYRCDICNKKFNHLSNLNEHRDIHTEGKLYECDICKKRFTRSKNLTAHKRIHVGDKPFRCNICNKQFTQSNNFNRHKRIHMK